MSKVDSNANANSADVDGNADECVVCFRTVEIFSIGECDHPVCYECSTRMRVLCQQNECPICRHVLSKVIFTFDKLPYRELEAKNRSEYYSKKYKIGFYTQRIQAAFFQLLDHPCPKCNVPPYRTFAGLQNHVRRDHDMFYCEICIDNLKIFTHERRCYTQAELKLHRIKGDPDNRSHRGHPLCEYCSKRFLDRDELFRHLRREHYFCHFCDADGCNEFYKDYDALAQHFRQDHFLCEEGRCATEQFVGAFRSEIDYKAHVANVHGKTLNKQQAKQTRTLQLEITLGPRGRSGQSEQHIANVHARGNEEAQDELNDYDEAVSNAAQQMRTIDAHNEQDFPSLSSGATTSVSLVPMLPAFRHRGTTSGLARTKENFPALGGNGVAAAANTGSGSNAAGSKMPAQQSMGAVMRNVPNTAAAANGSSAGMHIKVSKENFPALAAGSNKSTAVKTPTMSAVTRKAASNANSATPGMLIHVSNRPTQKSPASSNASLTSANNKKAAHLDFPALPSSSSKSKKNTSRALDEDMLPSNANVNMANVAAKHRTLVDDYVSVINPNNLHKFQLVQNQEMEAKATKAAEQLQAPKLTNADFPSLGGGGAAAAARNNLAASTTWKKTAAKEEKKQRELENRKAKVAPAPLLPTKSVTNTNKPNNNNNIAKKDKANKELKDMPAIKSNETIKKERNNNQNSNNEQRKIINDSNAAGKSPPGFGGGIGATKTPPGFQSNVTLNSVAKSPNNLTFTSSLGDSYSILPTHSYISLSDAQIRNQRLIENFQTILTTPEALDEFRQISNMFREGVYKAPAYYEHCRAALKHKFDEIFPELVVLLPDISKQQALYLAHTQRLNALPTEAPKPQPTFEVCPSCKQVLLESDLENHRVHHDLSKNFPTLGASKQSASQRK